MRILKKIICKLFAITTLPEGDYVATVTDVKVKYLKKPRLSLVTIKYTLEDVDTGIKLTYRETFIDNFYLLRCRNIMWFLETNGLGYVDYFDLIGAVFEVSVLYDIVCGKMVPMLVYQEVVTPPPSNLLT